MQADEALLPPRTRGALVSRFLLAHALSLPLAMGWACAAIPPIIHVHADELMAITEMEAVGQFLVRKIAYPAAVAAALEHLVVIPWLVARDPRRARRFFVVATAALYGLCAAVGAAGWIWLHLREG